MSVNTVSNKTFKYYFSWSFFFHLSFVALFFLFGKLVHDKISETRDYNIKLISASVKVDMVSMPKFTLKELKTMQVPAKGEAAVEKPSEKAAEVINKDDTVFEKKVAKPNFLDMMKGMSAKKVEKKKYKEVEKKGSDQGIGVDSNTLKKLVAEGNKISKGVALSGTGRSDQELSEFQMYASTVSAEVKQHWKLPGFLLDKNLKCRIRIYLKSDGSLLRSEIFESSGEKEFDNRAIKAVELAAPFSNVPSASRANALKGEIVLGFPL
ncbi:TonB C-terminal domain-containing protein [Halobacteriovorax sp. JY17]|uniref:TonB C-terminal domain-containing protein n=1 Tax=Halobacteriovorax sp. JY17 TaxID=2014617 RepID=UPI000C65A3D4|nr:TonB C-terminal domain-containing protein [Halobacteriovorax sp. JY17]PIK16506.1 MAG: hypothetical protein CES88_07135 [Halobacteriovorax sp. JY17]